ncbi:hypothetical protein FOA43_000108 [Brettanomyces nanus]|uniref:ADP-ribose 1''-phosphate phosphatase n=1 Tax=Eeniella nana TaxID=13502 RepID=A0A875RVX6_EENNA|nr:uncharacterized protein FOA43_000108 [Brettanomyces nanus]QPG72806.1 hypothetical protein FOA43_000108 [Brettanomyces nanus]
MSLICYAKGDLFELTKKASRGPVLLAHACNCKGVWGGGIAFAFKQRFYSAYKLYHNYCLQFKLNPKKLLGTSLLLPVSPKDRGFIRGIGEQIIIVCLFTSVMGEETENEIASNTENAMIDLKKQLSDPKFVGNEQVRDILNHADDSADKLLINMPKINAGIFSVPWSLTEQALLKSKLPCRVFVL